MIGNHLKEIEKKLRLVIIKESVGNALEGLCLFISIQSAVLVAACFAELWLNLGSGIRTVIFYGLIMISAALLTGLTLSRLVRNYLPFYKSDYFKIADKVGRSFPEIKDELLNVLQLVLKRESNYSNQLIEAAFETAYKKTKDKDFNKVISFGYVKRYLRWSVSAVVAGGLLFAAVPGLSYAAYRLLNYGTVFIPLQKFVFEVKPGNAVIAKGENIVIKIRATGESPKEITLSIKSEDQSEYLYKKLPADSLGYFAYEATSVKNSFDYRAEADGISSGDYRISVIGKPYITNFEATLTPPAYTQLPIQVQKDDGNIAALPGSLVKLSLIASRELSSASLSFSDNTARQMQVERDKAATGFPIAKEVEYRLLIKDGQGYSNVDPINYSIRILTDMPPNIEMISPNADVKLGKESTLSLVSKISDDYGFSGMNLNYRLAASKYRQAPDQFTKIPITISTKVKEDEIYFTWDLSPLVLAEGETLSYYLEVFDNDSVHGPKSAKTAQFNVTVPSFDEILAETDNKEQNIENELTQSFKDAERLKDEMEKIGNDLKQGTKEVSWQEKERIERAEEKFKQIGKNIEEASRNISEMKNELSKNNLLSEETLRKYNELQELLEQLNNEGLKDALKRLQESLQKMMRDSIQMSMEDMKANEEYIKKSLERTLNLLKRIQVEGKAEELKKQTDKLAEKIDELKSKTGNSSLSEKSDREELSNRQKDITEGLKNLNEGMKSLNEKMESMRDMPQKQARELEKELDEQNNESLSNEAEQDLKQEQKSPALENQGQLSRNMKKMSKGFQDLQAGMRKMNQAQTFYDMMKIMNDLVQLSKEQENLKNSTEQMGPYSQEFGERSKEENEIENNLNRVTQNMVNLSQKTFVITPEMGKSLGDASSFMRQSMESLHDQNGPQASQLQTKAMGSINEAAELLKSGMNQMMNGGLGGGMMSLMQQLQQMSGQQMDLNKLTQMLNQGQMSQEMMAQIERLARQQEMIRKSLEQLNREAKNSGESKRLAANLQKILDEMKEVVTNLQNRKIDDDLVKQQERILSKLLDAQKSINERDFEEERKSAAGSNVLRTSPAELILNGEEGKNKIKEELIKAMHEGYKKDYEELIKKYFDALQDGKK